tara:strand:+ start:756 stop:1145 length:390 start_codon:yes stop_codon:yes gene_type:complete
MSELDLLEVSEDEVSNITIDDEFKREKKYINPCKFDGATLRRRENEMKELVKLYPNVCRSWLELAWNFCAYTPQEEQDRIIASKEWEKPPINKRNVGGVIKNAMNILTKDEYEAELLKKLEEDKDVSGN